MQTMAMLGEHTIVGHLSRHSAIGYTISAGFQEDAGNFFTFVVILSLISLSASAIVFAISARVPVLFIGLLCIALTFVLSMVSWQVT